MVAIFGCNFRICMAGHSRGTTFYSTKRTECDLFITLLYLLRALVGLGISYVHSYHRVYADRRRLPIGRDEIMVSEFEGSFLYIRFLVPRQMVVEG